jgi:hypothetical protein
MKRLIAALIIAAPLAFRPNSAVAHTTEPYCYGFGGFHCDDGDFWFEDICDDGVYWYYWGMGNEDWVGTSVELQTHMAAHHCEAM